MSSNGASTSTIVEQELIASLLGNVGLRPVAEGAVADTDFTDVRLAEIFRALQALNGASGPVSLAALADDLERRMPVRANGGWPGFLARLIDDAAPCGVESVVRDMARRVRRGSIERRLREAAGALRLSPDDELARNRVRRLLAELDAVEPLTDTAPRLLTASEFARDAVPEAIVDRLVFQASTSSLAGPGKAGKTMLALQLAMCVASGRPFLGLGTRASRVLYASLEISAGMLRARMEAIASDCGIPMPEIGNNFHVVAPTRERCVQLDLLSEKGRATLRRLVEEARADVLILDTFYRFAPGADPNDNGAMGIVFSRINDLATATGAAVLVLDHTPKGDLGGPVSHAALGAQIKGGAVRVAIRLRRTTTADGGAWELDCESHFAPLDDAVSYRRPVRADGTLGSGCVACGATEALGVDFATVRDLFRKHGQRDGEGLLMIPSQRALCEAIREAGLATGNRDAEQIARAIERDHCAPETAVGRWAEEKPIRLRQGKRGARIYTWRSRE